MSHDCCDNSIHLKLSQQLSVVISQHGKANLHSERVGSPVPKEKARACLLRHTLQPASAAQLSGVFGSAIFCAKPSVNLNFHHRTQPLHCRLLLPFVTSHGSGTSFTLPRPRSLSTCCFSVSLPDPRDYYKAQRILAWFLRNTPSTQRHHPIYF